MYCNFVQKVQEIFLSFSEDYVSICVKYTGFRLFLKSLYLYLIASFCMLLFSVKLLPKLFFIVFLSKRITLKSWMMWMPNRAVPHLGHLHRMLLWATREARQARGKPHLLQVAGSRVPKPMVHNVASIFKKNLF